jgi:hypothetical protein
MTLDTRQRTFGWEDREPTRLPRITHEDLAVLQAIGAGTLPLPPAVETLGVAPLDTEERIIAFAGNTCLVRRP